jgi:hypothetical protein
MKIMRSMRFRPSLDSGRASEIPVAAAEALHGRGEHREVAAKGEGGAREERAHHVAWGGDDHGLLPTIAVRLAYVGSKFLHSSSLRSGRNPAQETSATRVEKAQEISPIALCRACYDDSDAEWR